MISTLFSIAKEAGERILDYYGAEGPVDRKADNSPLTLADRASHAYIVQQLRRNWPDIPVLSEESPEEDYAERASWKRFWLVDPLDGTKEFIKRTGEFTINIALIEEGHPIVWLVYVPVKQWTYFAKKEQGAYYTESGLEEAQAIHTDRVENPQKLRVVASRDHAGPAVRALLEALPEAETRSMGSSLKFCLVAEGKADLYFRDVPTMEWDTAAAQCIVEEAGGGVFTVSGEPLTYNKSSLRNPSLVTVGDLSFRWKPLIRQALEEAA